MIAAASQIIAMQRTYRQRRLAEREARRHAAADARARKAEARREVNRLPMTWTRKAVLHALQGFHFANRGVIRKTVAAIAAKAKLSERTVQRCLRELEENGLIEVSGETGRGKARLYRVLRYVISSAAENLRAALRRRRERVTQSPSGKGDTRVRVVMDRLRSAFACGTSAAVPGGCDEGPPVSAYADALGADPIPQFLETPSLGGAA